MVFVSHRGICVSALGDEMSISRRDGYAVFICDECAEEFESRYKEFFEATHEARRDGWLVERKEIAGWKHLCPACKPQFKPLGG